MKKTEIPVLEALRNDVTDELRVRDEKASRDAYTRLLANKAPSASSS